ncbi:MAG: hypothetical protein D6729_13025 [Deltaproteobacteria bacterium]|nr:MAG: hypothetical protein D6729_13025 [Deltaproteobacteria bacterium]
MALIVFPYQRATADAPIRRLDTRPPPPCSEVFGTDASRQGLWGHEIVREIGLEVLPRLASTDLYVHADAFGRLERDIEVLRRELRRVAEATEHRVDWIAARLDNLEAALTLARQHGEGAGVYIGSDDLAGAAR